MAEEKPEKTFITYDPKTGETIGTLTPDPNDLKDGKIPEELFGREVVENVELSIPKDFSPREHELFVDVGTKSIKTKKRSSIKKKEIGD